jgi:phage head maturation protease
MSDTIEMLSRAAKASAGTANEEARTVEVTFASDAPVRRSSWQDGAFDEVLEISREAIMSARLQMGMSLLDSHRTGSVADRLGSVVPGSLKIVGNEARVTVKLSRSDKAESIWRDILDGHHMPISVGYRIHEQTRSERTDSEIPEVRATAWEPMEISVVSVPADSNASTRQQEDSNMTTQQNRDDKTTRTRADEESDILSLARRFKIDLKGELVTRAFADKLTFDKFREALLDHLSEQDERSGGLYITPMEDVLNPGRHSVFAQARQDRSDAIYARVSGTAPTERAQPYMGMSLLEHAKEILQQRGEFSRTMTPDEIFKRTHHTGDFPLLLKATGNRMLVDAYQLAQSPLKTAIARASTIDDFRKKSRLKISDIDLLKKVEEGGEIKHTSRGETAEGYALDTYASMFRITRQALINDDLGAFADFNRTAGRMAAETENELLFSLLTANSGSGPTLEETGNALFHADHGNLAGSGTVIDVTALQAARLAMRKQKSLGGKSFINATPKYLMVGPERETQAEQVLATLAAATVDEVNPFAGRLTLLVEPRIESNAWYLFADPANVPTIEYSYLSTQPGPQFESEEAFDTLGSQFRVYLDFGCGAVDFRGAYRNPGA